MKFYLSDLLDSVLVIDELSEYMITVKKDEDNQYQIENVTDGIFDMIANSIGANNVYPPIIADSLSSLNEALRSNYGSDEAFKGEGIRSVLRMCATGISMCPVAPKKTRSSKPRRTRERPARAKQVESKPTTELGLFEASDCHEFEADDSLREAAIETSTDNPLWGCF